METNREEYISNPPSPFLKKAVAVMAAAAVYQSAVAVALSAADGLVEVGGTVLVAAPVVGGLGETAPELLDTDAEITQYLVDHATSESEKREYQALQYFIGAGYTRAQSVGIVANLMKESAGTMDPTIHQFGGGPGVGIAQWTFVPYDPTKSAAENAEQQKYNGRYNGLVAFADEQGGSWDDLVIQLAYVHRELETTQSAAREALLSTTTAYDATAAVLRKYERPRDQTDDAVHARYDVYGAPLLAAMDAVASCSGAGASFVGSVNGSPIWERGVESGTTYLCKLPDNVTYEEAGQPENEVLLDVPRTMAVMAIIAAYNKQYPNAPLEVIDGYRTYDEQAAARVRNGCPDMTSPSSTCEVPTAPPGTSRHNTARAVDFAHTGQERHDAISSTIDQLGITDLKPMKNGTKSYETWHFSSDGN